MTIHAGTEEREILDNLLTDYRFKAMDRSELEDLIERIATPLANQLNNKRQAYDELEEENLVLKDIVATFEIV